MARSSLKKTSNLRRTRSIEMCIQEAKDFIQAGRKGMTRSKNKKVKKPISQNKLARKTTLKKVEKKTVKSKRAKSLKKPSLFTSISPAKPPLFTFSPAPLGTGIFSFSGSSSFEPMDANKTTFRKGKNASECSGLVNINKKMKQGDTLPLPAFGMIEVCFCLDATGSMGSELAQAKSTINNLIEKVSKKVNMQGLTIRFSIVAYHDHGDSNALLEIQDFTDAGDATKFTNGLTAMGGGDEPEAVHDAILAACTKLSWTESVSIPMVRYIFHVLDAPPHGKQFDNNQPQEGCKCGLKTSSILDAMNSKQIHYRMVKVRKNVRVDKAEEIFKSRLGNFDSADIGSAQQMDVRVSDMVIHEVLPSVF